MFVPIILGSNKTTVSVATGQNDYYPLYASIGNVHNNVRCTHRNAVAIIAFLAIPKCEFSIDFKSKMFSDIRIKFAADKHYQNNVLYRNHRRQLFHTSLSTILKLLHPAMSSYEIVLCPDGHFRCIIYGIGPYIADYPKQALLACIVSGWCPRYVMTISVYY